MMSLPVVHLSSDSEDDDNVFKSVIVSSNRVPTSFNAKETNPKFTHTCSCKCNQTTTQVEPLFRVIFKDEDTARKYRLRIEDILKYVITSKITHGKSESSFTSLVLEVYDPAVVATQKKSTPKVSQSTKEIQTEPTVASSTKEIQTDPITYNDNQSYSQTVDHGNFPPQLLNKNIKQEKIIENEKKRKSQPQVQETPEISHSNKHDLLQNDAFCVKKKIKVEHTTEKITNNKPESEQEVETNGDNESCPALTIIYQKILKQEHPQERRILETCFENNSVEIGSFRYFNRGESIFISKDGLTFFVPTFMKNSRNVILSIELDEITKVVTNFSKTKPALFFYVRKKTADGIRDLLSMNDPNGPYIDAASMNPIHQRIAILPSNISDESKEVIRELFKNIEIIEVNEAYAESLLATETIMSTKVPKKAEPTQKSTGSSHQVKKKINDSVSHCETENSSSELQNINQYSIVTGKNSRTIFFCRVLRVGSYEYSKKRVFSIDRNGIKICVPHISNVLSIVTVNIKIEKIIKIRVNFSKACPVIFLYVCTEAAEKIRKSIGMTNPSGPYFDPDSRDETCNKIIILPQQIPKTCKIVQELSKIGLIEKLTNKMANDLLVQSFLKDGELNTLVAKPKKKKLCFKLVSNNVRIGTYQCMNLKINFHISDEGLKFHVPKIGSKVFKSITIAYNEMTKVYYSMPLFALLFCTTVTCAERIRSIIGMPDISNGSVYFNPNSPSIAEQRLVIVFEKPKRHGIATLRSILNNTLSEEVSKKIATKMISSIL